MISSDTSSQGMPVRLLGLCMAFAALSPLASFSTWFVGMPALVFWMGFGAILAGFSVWEFFRS